MDVPAGTCQVEVEKSGRNHALRFPLCIHRFDEQDRLIVVRLPVMGDGFVLQGGDVFGFQFQRDPVGVAGRWGIRSAHTGKSSLWTIIVGS